MSDEGMRREQIPLVSRTRCSVLHAAPQSRDLSRRLQGVGPGISSATRRNGGARITRRQPVVKWLMPYFVITIGIYFSLGHPHIVSMANWQQSSFTREPPKTKAELRQMLAEAVRNTQPSADHGPKRLPKAKSIPAAAACVD